MTETAMNRGLRKVIERLHYPLEVNKGQLHRPNGQPIFAAAHFYSLGLQYSMPNDTLLGHQSVSRQNSAKRLPLSSWIENGSQQSDWPGYLTR